MPTRLIHALALCMLLAGCTSSEQARQTAAQLRAAADQALEVAADLRQQAEALPADHPALPAIMETVQRAEQAATTARQVADRVEAEDMAGAASEVIVQLPVPEPYKSAAVLVLGLVAGFLKRSQTRTRAAAASIVQSIETARTASDEFETAFEAIKPILDEVQSDAARRLVDQVTQ